jgi:putative transposase
MSRPLRIEFPGAVYHVTSRGDRREPIYRDDDDRALHLAVLAQALDRFDAQALSYCLMGNHYHVVLHTRQANMSRVMRHVNGVYTQRFNQRHGLVGHLFQGRFKAILVDSDAYLVALCRYVERNPVAAALVPDAAAWRWSSYRSHVGVVPAPPWLASDQVHAHLLGHDMTNAVDQRTAQRRYAALVNDTTVAQPPLWQTGLRQQIYLGSDDFVERMQRLASVRQSAEKEIPQAHRVKATQPSAGPLETWAICLARCQGQRDQAMHAAYRDGLLTMSALARTLGLSLSRVSRVVAQQEAQQKTQQEALQ